jgi:hypothetical protein
MLEETRRCRRRERFGPGPGPADPGGPAGPATGDLEPVTVSHGPYSERLPVANMSVAEIRARFHDRFDIDPTSQAVLDGTEVSDDVTVKPGQLLMFIRRAGEKGQTTGPATMYGSGREAP